MKYTIAFLMIVATPLAAQQDASEVMAAVEAARAHRMANVKNYVVITKVPLAGNMEAPEYYEDFAPMGAPVFRLVPISEWQRNNPANQGLTEDQLKDAMHAYADALGLLSGGLANEMGSVPGSAMFSDGLTKMTDDMSKFMDMGADSMSTISDGRQEAGEKVRDLRRLANRATLVGTEDVDGRSAFHLKVTDFTGIDLEQPDDGSQFTLKEVNTWYDDSALVQLHLRIDGELEAKGKITPVVIEMFEKDYKFKDGVYLPARRIMRMSGLMEAVTSDPKQRKELEDARKKAAEMQVQLANMQGQMADMPAAARNMIRGQLDKALKQLDMILADGRVEVETLQTIYSVNQGAPYDWTPLGGWPNQGQN